MNIAEKNTEKEEKPWESRILMIFVMCFASLSNISIGTLPFHAATFGSFGALISYIIIYVVVGIPMLYLELIIGQFTGRDCIDIWKIRKCTSEIAYIVILYQLIYMIYTFYKSATFIYYFMSSFRNPIPYSHCGPWSSKYCEIINNNFTIYRHCFHDENPSRECKTMFVYFSEVQYYRGYLFRRTGLTEFIIAWPTIVAAAFTAIIVYIICFKKHISLKYCVKFMTFMSVICYMFLTFGSMFQKGVVSFLDSVMDFRFTKFHQADFNEIICNVLNGLSLGSGIFTTLAAKGEFRAPAYGNAVIVTAINCAFLVLAVFTTALMYCPSLYIQGTSTYFYDMQFITLTLEKAPLLLKHYDSSRIWLIIYFFVNSIFAIRSCSIRFYILQEIVTKRSKTISKYITLFTLLALVILFLISFPFLTYFGAVKWDFVQKSMLFFTSTFISIAHFIVFVFWYGIGKLSEDIHFMQGLQPNAFTKLGWIWSFLCLCYTFIRKIYYVMTDELEITGDVILFGKIWLCGIVLFTFTCISIRLTIAAFRNKLKEELELDKDWGPSEELMMRSRTMFTAHAMTKEYMYRQYHLQAGIKARQRASNVRSETYRLNRNSNYIH